ncbi:hypothetical protein CROQUDRAFT_92055 [Cronartium quercuum f. sp. fusiforme G11]|uniref:Uncharacterized protein n=1 Tax=Cronartium quercuum f. sp. fusiforme G11 TaxID=708437 RepID=A0A9P6NMS8_9BASI|nr:hypothetical protein CROQUDRAFT_92055 [Cronartium quercuum f. sp. fusiforme G11]
MNLVTTHSTRSKLLIGRIQGLQMCILPNLSKGYLSTFSLITFVEDSAPIDEHPESINGKTWKIPGAVAVLVVYECGSGAAVVLRAGDYGLQKLFRA